MSRALVALTFELDEPSRATVMAELGSYHRST
jgi:hypothetical protein